MVEKVKGIISKRESISPDVDLFQVKLEKNMSFTPGQFAMVYLNSGEKEVRAFSFCSLPDGNIVEFCIKLYKDGRFSPLLFKKQVGDEVEIKGPYGMFGLKETEDPIIFIAGGTGIAPIRSMILSHIKNNGEQQAWLFYRFKNPEDFLFKTELEQISKECEQMHIVPTVSNPDKDWAGNTERVHNIILKYVGSLEHKQIYM